MFPNPTNIPDGIPSQQTGGGVVGLAGQKFREEAQLSITYQAGCQAPDLSVSVKSREEVVPKTLSPGNRGSDKSS